MSPPGRRAEARAPSSRTFRRRQAAARERARLQGWAGIVVGLGPNFRYLCGSSIEPSERLTCLLLPVEGEPLLVCPAFEADRLGEQSRIGEVRSWRDGEDPFPLLAGSVAWGEGPIGLDPGVPFGMAQRILAALDGLSVVDAGPVLTPLRAIKGEEELFIIREAARRTLAVIEGVFAVLSEGMTEREAARGLEARLRDHSPEGGWGLVQFGAGTASPHGEPGERGLRAGDPVLIDAGVRLHGYTADLTRTVAFGEPAREVREVYEVVLEAQRAALGVIRAGRPCQEVDQAARSVIERAGWGGAFTHRLGHGIGLEIHEPPYLVAGNEENLEDGQVVTVEPGIYLPGRFGVRLEDDVRIGPHGAEPLVEPAGELLVF